MEEKMNPIVTDRKGGVVAVRPTRKEKSKSKPIDSDTFRPTGKNIGFGCWGSVDLYEGIGGEKWAIKYFSPSETALQQMQKRGWTEERVMREEAIPIQAAQHHVVPRIIERDKQGQLYVAMPYFEEGNLSGKIRDLDLESSLRVASDVADALRYVHDSRETNWDDFFSKKTSERKAHGDIKPSNILIANGRAFLTDFGSSTCVTVGGNGSQRGEHGDINYRAPEAFSEEAKPSTSADVWGLGAILYESVAKQGIYDGTEGLHDLPQKEAQKIINRKIRKNIPRRLRKFIRGCLAVDPSERFYDGSEAAKNLEKTVEHMDGKKELIKHVKKWGLSIGIPTVLAGFLGYQALTYEPQKLSMPDANRVTGIIYKPGAHENPNIEFETEQIDSLPDTPTGWAMSGVTQMAKLSTDNRIVAYLSKTYSQATQKLGLFATNGYYTDKMLETYLSYTNPDERKVNDVHAGPVWPIIAKSIEVALNQSETKDGKVDLEDVMATTRLGIETVDKAKRYSGSLDYKIYRNAQDENGKSIIHKKERNIIDTWIAY